ncbi:Starch-binding associating with outer membrane [Pedobacter suwonensis]|uniref:Starch-binding associating with outer membrane n=1 Tax=Pedobacter suwonensis TaxID=332999 RepID=A0A1I0SJ33_9SPHI|nr:RagB/SusD family nutrient uptake outer membrane protein [Pedobacter suwonensis]SFA39427.1 Starch-binding associating with outer membrane [Pedobacter suwonensis]
MKKIKIYFTLGCIMTVLFTVVSCKKYLDITPDNLGTLDYAFRNRNEAENYLYSCYAYLQRMNDVASNPGFTTSSELIYSNTLDNYQGFNPTGFNLLRGTQTAANPGLNAWDGSEGSYSLWRSIRICNIMLENIDKPIDLGAAEKQRWIAETKFLKAYYHYVLFKMYGPIPLIKTNLAINSSTDEVRIKRAPVDETVDYIVSLLDEAIPGLPAVISSQATELGRVTSVIALSVKADVLATAASPLFNGNSDYISFKDKDGLSLFPAAYDAQKWKKAADAAKAAITAAETQGVKLYTFQSPTTVGKLSDSLKRELDVQNAVTEKWELNSEIIWASNPEFNYQGFATPRLTAKSAVNNFSNPSTFSAPISTQELFYTVNGVPISEDKTWDYAGRNTVKTGDNASRYYIKQGYETIKGHFARETRFYADMAFDGSIWFGNGRNNQDDPVNPLYYVSARGSGLAAPSDNIRLNITGYWPKKLVSYASVYDDGFQPSSFRLPLIRLAGLYLLYAEALNEVNGPTAEVFTYIDKVRQRAGLQGIQSAWTNFSKNPNKFNTKDGLRQIIHQERRIELCFEGQSGWDLRRWKELQAVLTAPIQGWSINNAEAINYYRPTTQFIPVFGLKDYLWPIRSYDLVVNPNLVQNPYW